MRDVSTIYANFCNMTYDTPLSPYADAVSKTFQVNEFE